MHTVKSTEKGPKPILRKPNGEDGSSVWELIRECKPLDENSMYCNLIQCDHFGETCVLAELDGDVVGWVSGHVVPDEPDTVFVWQVAVSEKARGLGLGTRMLSTLLARDACDQVTKLKTTITKDNEASWTLFRRFAEKRGGTLSSEAHFKKDDHFDGKHSTEHMVTIRFAEPLKRAA